LSHHLAMALPAGVPPASFRLEDGCLMYSATAALKLVSAAGLAPAVPRFQAEHVAATPRAVRPNWLRSSRWGTRITRPQTLAMALKVRIRNWRSRRDLHPHSSRRQRVAFLFSYRSRMVGSAGNAPVVASSLFDDIGFTDRQPDHLPLIGSGSGSHTHLKKFM